MLILFEQETLRSRIRVGLQDFSETTDSNQNGVQLFPYHSSLWLGRESFCIVVDDVANIPFLNNVIVGSEMHCTSCPQSMCQGMFEVRCIVIYSE